MQLSLEKALLGGALAIGVANQVWMLENAIYSILSPEGYSSILWKDPSRFQEAAEKMKLTAQDLKQMQVIDKIIPEPRKIDDKAFEKIAKKMKSQIQTELAKMEEWTAEEIVEDRCKKFRKICEIKEETNVIRE